MYFFNAAYPPTNVAGSSVDVYTTNPSIKVESGSTILVLSSNKPVPQINAPSFCEKAENPQQRLSSMISVFITPQDKRFFYSESANNVNCRSAVVKTLKRKSIGQKNL